MTAYGGTFEEGARELARALEGSVRDCIGGAEVAAIAFSGGLDSSVLVACAKKVARVVACTAAMEGAADVGVARRAATTLGVELLTRELKAEDVAKELETMRLPFEATPMDASLWTLYSTVARCASEAGAGVLLLGQLADELFGGYAKYRGALETGGEAMAQEAMSGDVEGYEARGRARDFAACSRWLEPKFPFESETVRLLGLSFPVSFKIAQTGSKLVLREAARNLGVPDALSMAPKKAAQYSSGIQKAVIRTSLFNGRRPEAPHDSIAAAKR